MANIHTLNSITLKNWIDNNEVVLIDVREVIEYKICSIPNSINLPVSKVTMDEVKVAKHKDKKLVFHCKTGNRAMKACKKLIQEGIDVDIWNLEGGIESWKENNLSTISSKNTLPLERQVQIVISTLILSGLGLYYFLNNPLFLIIPFIVGLGLLNAGMTGWCGMAKLIAKMPWNK